MTGLVPLVLIVLALGVMIRVIKIKKVGIYLIVAALTPVLIGLAIAVTGDIYSSVSPVGKL